MTRMNNKVYEVCNRVLSLLFPDRCPFCSKVINYGEVACADCYNAFQRKHRQFRVGDTDCYSVCEYNDNNSKVVLGAKKQRDFSKLSFMASEIYDLLRAYGINEEIDIIVPVPMSRIKRIKRGYNHTEKISRHLSFLSSIKTVKALRKVKETKEQKTLGREQRLINLKDCYRVNNKNVPEGKTVLVIDDVTTTGSTLIEVSDLLRKHGNKVICAVFARTPFKENE